MKLLDDVGMERKLVLGSFLFMFITFATTGFLMERTVNFSPSPVFSQELPVTYAETASLSTVPTKLRAEVKGSIYETGSNMTVYGACFDGNSYLLPDANATFTAWYPNGTIVTGPNATMDKIYDDFQGNHPNGTGRWKIHVTMSSTIGTYLTEMRCEYAGEYAVAMGEWQNPEWVKRIGDTQVTANQTYVLLQNVSSVLQTFQNDTNTSFTDVLTAISSITGGSSGPGQLNEIENAMAAIDRATWVLMDPNPFFVLASGVHNYTAVDMLAENNMAAVSTDGYFDLWDGETWTEQNPGIAFKGVSVLSSIIPYAWGVGSSGGVAVYSVNGAAAENISGCGSPTGYNDVRLFTSPNTPSTAFYTYLLGNDGSVCFSDNVGITWNLLGYVPAGSDGRISQVVENHGPTGQPNGYATLIGQGNQVMFDNGITQTLYNVSGTIADVGLKYSNLGYVITKDAIDSKIYKFNGSGLTIDYVINDSLIFPTAVQVIDSNDVWVSTADPAVLYHYDGHAWKYDGFGTSGTISVIISFGNVSNGAGIHDMTMSDGRTGYAVGTDGLILVMRSEGENQFSKIMSALAVLNQSMNIMNSSLNYKLDNVLANLTYSQLYLSTTLYPLINATYQNTLQILIDLGIIQGQLNQTLQLQNSTLQIVNATDQKVDQLLNKSNRIRAWVTQ